MRYLKKRIIFASLLVATLLSIGTVYYNHEEGWSHVDAFYFSTMTLTTIGYGDLAPTTQGAKIFTSFYAIFGIGIMLYILSSVIGVFIFKQERRVTKAFKFIKKLRKHEKEISSQETSIEALEKKVAKPKIKKLVKKHGKKIKELEKQVRPSIEKFREQEKEIRSLKKKIKKK